jgi:transketolase
MVLEPFAERFPDRFINAGVAEQNMLGVATGLADGGMIPFVYSIATFATLRPYEFIRNGPALHRLPVRIVGVGGGLDYGQNGITHWALEDIGVLRLQPEMTVIAPADAPQTRAAVMATRDVPGPVYLRLAKLGPTIDGLDGRFELGRGQVLGDGDDVVLIAVGNVVEAALGAAELLRSENVGAMVFIVSSVRPAPVDDLLAVLRRVPLAVTVESHYIDGGIGSLVAEVIAEHRVDARLIRAGVRSMPSGATGSSDYLHGLHGLSAQALARSVNEALGLARA